MWTRLYTQIFYQTFKKEKMNQKYTNINKQILEKEYITNRLSEWEITKKYNIPRTTVHRYLIKHNIPRRTLSQSLKGKLKGIPKSKEHKRKIGLGNKGKTVSKESRKKMSISAIGKMGYWKNKKLPKETRILMSIFAKQRFINPKNHPMYIDGRTSLSVSIRNMIEYKEWRIQVFKRDNFTCQDCGQIGGSLEAHHKKVFADLLTEFLKEYDQFSPIEDKETLIRLAMKYKPFWDADNGITLCKNYHRTLKRK